VGLDLRFVANIFIMIYRLIDRWIDG
jgi:hypothetical protein